MTEPLVYRQIVKVMGAVRPVGKDQKNQNQGFKFRGVDDIVNAVSPAMKQHELFLVPTVLEEREMFGQTSSNKPMKTVVVKVRYELYAVDGSSVSSVVVAEANDTADKATAKAMSVALRTMLLQTFMIPTGDEDPDSSYHEHAQNVKPVHVQWQEHILGLVRKIGAEPKRVNAAYTEKYGNAINHETDTVRLQQFAQALENGEVHVG
jgi:hypothetical protein